MRAAEFREMTDQELDSKEIELVETMALLRLRHKTNQLDSTARVYPWIRELLQYDPLPTAKLVRTPVLVLQGETDQQVTPEQADTLAATFRAGGNRNITVHRLPGTNHLFQRDTSGVPAGYGTLPDRRVTAEALGYLADWLAVTLRVSR